MPGLVVVLNDNEMSIAPPVGAMSAYLTRLLSSHSYMNLRDLASRMAKRFPRTVATTARRAEEYARGILTGGTLFEELGFYYLGPIDGHNLDQLLPVLRNVRDAEERGPILVHAITQKGRGYAPAEASADKLHAVSRFNVVTGEQVKAPPGPPSYTRVFADALIAEAEADPAWWRSPRRCRAGTGLDRFAKRFPDRCFDVGIAEQHAVTFAAGMATRGHGAVLRHLQHVPAARVRPGGARRGDPGPAGALRAGPRRAGGGGRRHARRQLRPGLPRLPARHGADGAVRRGGAGAHGGDRRRRTTPGRAPCATRAARAPGWPCRRAARRCRSAAAGWCGEAAGAEVAILCLGPRLAEALVAADELAARGLRGTVADARFAKPLDTALLERLAREHAVLVTIEDGSVGGFGAAVMQHLAWAGLLDGGLRVRPMVLPDRFLDHDTPAKQSSPPASPPKTSCGP